MESGFKQLSSTDLAVVTTSKQGSYGDSGFTKDGRWYRYVQYAGTVTAGNLVIAPALVTAHQNISVQTAAAAGATTVYVTLGAAAATQDQYAEGYLTIGVAGSGVPVTRKIKGNTAGNSSAVIQVFLDGTEPLLNALTTSNVVSLSPSIYNGVTASTTAGVPVGVAVASAVANNWGWVQTQGPVAVVNDAAGSLSALGKVKQSTTVAGAVTTSSGATDVQLGTVIQPMNASAAGLVSLTMDA